jgi:hypothetical protein
VKLRFIASDNPNNSVTEAGIDDVRVCFSGSCATVNVTRAPGDVNNDSNVDVSDMLAVIAGWGTCVCPADLNRDGLVNVTDLLAVIENWG